jgi:pyruvate dehydrogenase (quinone)
MANTASDLFVERLMEWGVDTVFGLAGDGINGFSCRSQIEHGSDRRALHLAQVARAPLDR